MKKLFLTLSVMLLSASTYATVDAHSRSYIVVKDIQTEEFFVERAPIIGCYGLGHGPQLAQLTTEYKATSNIGCGGPIMYDNINYLTCANVIDAKESADDLSFSDITLDISKCKDKNNPQLITMIRTAVKLNFPQKKGEVRLKLIK